MPITKDEAEKWLERLTPAETVTMLQEHHQLKQELCSQVLGVPTGSADWVSRAITKGTRLRIVERQFERVIRGGIELLEDARFQARETTCTNCHGNCMVQGASCQICHGSGSRPI